MHFMEELSGTIWLRWPSGNVWKVQVARTVDDVHFQNGWEIFVQDHSLAETNLLVFRYNGFSSFNVFIFDETACEREGAYFVKKHSSCSNNGCFLQKKVKKVAQCGGVEGLGGKVQEKKMKDGSGGEGMGVGKKEQKGNIGKRVGKRVIRNKESVGPCQGVMIDLDEDESKRRSFSRKQNRCGEEDESVSLKSQEKIGVRTFTIIEEKRRRTQNTAQAVVSQRCFQLKTRHVIKRNSP